MPQRHVTPAMNSWWTDDHESDDDDSVDVPGAAELVGWAHRGLHAVTPTAARAVLAAALDLAEDEMGQLSPDSVIHAVSRLANMVHHYQHVIDEVGLDDLTGALRRRAGLSSLQREIDRARRSERPNVVVAFMDLNGLKQINDTHGHRAGDELLCDLVAVVRRKLRSYDLIIRWGGDEFVCVLSNSNIEQAHRKMADIADDFLIASPHGGGVSYGLATLEDGDSAASLIERADTHLYAGRRERRSTAAHNSPPG